MIDKVLALIPSWVTGRIGPRARREVRSWIRGNAVLRTHRYGLFRRFLMWGSDNPMPFAVLVGLLAVGSAYLLAFQTWTTWSLPAPALKKDFDIAAYAGVPWSVQATLVALVYPIVLSFIALMLQRKAHSTVSLRVYLLDSAVVPAGASSVGLLLAMGAQYFATPYSSPRFLAQFMAPLLVMNSAWLLLNLLLTGFFLSRTVRFIQEEEQQNAVTRMAVDVALHAELVAAVKQHIFVNAPQSDWGFPGRRFDDGPEPQVSTLSVRQGRPAVKRDIKGRSVLHDVHLRLLHLVVALWKRRAAKFNAGRNGKTPTLTFPPMMGGEASGEIVLCSIEDGPALRWYERGLVRLAFVYKPFRSGALSLTTRKMLEEIGREVESAAEQQRFGAAVERLHAMMRLHGELLRACAVDAEGLEGNAATIGISPYAWGARSFDNEWLNPYLDMGRIALNQLEEDPRLFRTLASIPASIGSELPPRPEQLLINAQLAGMNLANQLAGWWMRKADASLAPGATSFSGTLPAPLSKVYEKAVVEFIGSWNNLSIRVPKELSGGDSATWQTLTGRALVYASHIENSVELFLEAVSRGDETGAVWLLENFLKWWGGRQHELDCADIQGDFRVRHATLTLAQKDWEVAKTFLWDGTEPVTIEFASKALSFGILRHWESMRLYVVLLLIKQAGETPAADSRELRLAATLISARPQKDGGSVDARPLDNIDDVLTRLLGTLFGVETAKRWLNGFADRLSWKSTEPEVSGWIYSWSGSPPNMSSLKRALAVLLLAVASENRTGINRSKRLVERWWKDLDNLEKVERYLAELRKEVLSGAFTSRQTPVMILQSLRGKAPRRRAGCRATAEALKKLQAVAAHERGTTLRALPVDVEKVRGLGLKIAAHAFNATAGLPPPVERIDFSRNAATLAMSTSITCERKWYLEGFDAGSDDDLAERIGDLVQQTLLQLSFGKLVADFGLKPVNGSELRELHDATSDQMRAYLSAVATQCSSLEALGVTPVILVGRTAARTLLNPWKWGTQDWRCLPPEGVIVSTGEPRHPRTFSVINGIPVFRFDTPEGDCYVLNRDILKSLAVEGTSASNAITIDWEAVSEEQLKLTLKWRAGFL